VYIDPAFKSITMVGLPEVSRASISSGLSQEGSHSGGGETPLNVHSVKKWFSRMMVLFFLIVFKKKQ